MKEIVKIKKGLDFLIESAFHNQDIVQPKLIFEEIAQDKNLQILYFCVNNFQHPPLMNESEINDFIDENIKLAKEVESTILSESLSSVKELELSELDQAIGTILFETRTAINFTKYNKSRKIVYESILNKIKPSGLDLSEFDEKDVQFVKEYIENPQEKVKQICNECIAVLDEKLSDDNLDNETKLLVFETKTKLLENQINCKFQPENVIDLLKLKKNLID